MGAQVYPNLSSFQYQPYYNASAPPAEAEDFYSNVYPKVPTSNPPGGKPFAPPASKEHANAGVDLNDDCTICLEKFRDRPDGDPYNGTVLSKTECNHYFHNFCLESFLKVAAHKDCPLCRRSVDASKVKWIPVEELEKPVAPAVNNAKPVQPGNAIDAAKVASDIGNATLGLGKAVLWGAGRAAWASLKFGGNLVVAIASAALAPDPLAAEKNKKKLEDSSIQQLNRWGKTSNDMIKQLRQQSNEAEIVYTTIYSLPPAKNKQAKESLQRMEIYTNIFAQKLKDAHAELHKSLEDEKIILSY